MMLGFLAQIAPPPYLEYGAFAAVLVVFIGAARAAPLLIKSTLATIKDMSTEFTAASKQARDDFRDERKMEREFMEEHGKQNRAAIGRLELQVGRATVATIAASKGADVDRALETYEKANGGERSGSTYAGERGS